MIFVYDKRTNELVGVATEVIDNGTSRQPTLEELYPDRDRSNLGFLQVEDSPRYALHPDRWQAKLDETGTPIGIERRPTPAKLYLTTDAIDTDGDDLPELIADGSSKATITAEVKDARGELVTEALTLNFKTTGGALSARRVTTTTGQAIVELTASLETVSVIVEVSAEGVTSSSLGFEFMPREQ
ncbi:Ig-like domain-containing protein [Phormidesmis priestleyi]